MCGIFGWVVGASRSPDRGELVRLTDLLTHRGPDGGGYELLETRDGRFSIGLANRRLSILDLSTAGSQPMWSDDRRFCLIFNGEIYNYVELRAELQALGHAFVSTSDTEVLLEAYRAWGKGAVLRFRGMFAFALFDTREDTILLARDPFGKKPLFFGERGADVFFGSEIEPIANAPGFSRVLDPDALGGYLLDRYVPGPRTFLAGIHKLQPGFLATWRAGRFVRERYYTPPLATTSPDIDDFGEAVRQLSAIFDDAVRIRMRSDAPFGAFLSGGLDSSAVVGTMIRHACGPVKTFSVGFEDESFSELSYCRTVARHFGTDHHDVTVSAQHFFDSWDEAVLRRGAPVSEASDIPMMLLSKAARSSVKVVLTGEGADEFLAGYPKHVAELYTGLYRSLVPSWLHTRIVQPLVEVTPYRMRRLKVLAKALGQRDTADRVRIWFGELSREQRDALLGHEGRGTDTDSFPLSLTNASDLRRSQFFDQTSYLPDNSLERADRMMMAGSIEGRMPFMDIELVRLAARIPDRFHIRKLRGKSVLRSAFQGIVPREILRRSKNGFRVPINAWFRTSHRDVVRDLLTSERSHVRGFLDPAIIDGLVASHLEGRVNNERVLWSLANLEQFIRVYKPDLSAVEARAR